MSQAKLDKAVAAVTVAESKLEVLRAAVVTIQAEIAAEALRLNIEVGTVGTFVFGRAATAATLTGKVLVVVELEGGAKLLKVAAGEGVAFKIYDVAPSKFTPVVEEAEGVTADPIVAAVETVGGASADLPFDVDAALNASGALTDADAAVAAL